jgi:hypothetical protein
MKHIKTYEHIFLTDIGDETKLEIGDFVYCEVPETEYRPNKFIGKLENISQKQAFPYEVSFPVRKEDRTRNQKNLEDRIIRRYELKLYAKTLDELYILIQQNKYNL